MKRGKIKQRKEIREQRIRAEEPQRLGIVQMFEQERADKLGMRTVRKKGKSLEMAGEGGRKYKVIHPRKDEGRNIDRFPGVGGTQRMTKVERERYLMRKTKTLGEEDRRIIKVVVRVKLIGKTARVYIFRPVCLEDCKRWKDKENSNSLLRFPV